MKLDKEITYTITATEDEIDAIDRALTAALRVTQGAWPPGYEVGFKMFVKTWQTIAGTIEEER